MCSSVHTHVGGGDMQQILLRELQVVANSGQVCGILLLHCSVLWARVDLRSYFVAEVGGL